MVRPAFLIVSTIIANAAGLLLASFLLTGFTIDAMSFVVVLLVCTGVMILTGTLVTKVAVTSMPQIRGSISLVSAFLGLKVTEWLMPASTSAVSRTGWRRRCWSGWEALWPRS